MLDYEDKIAALEQAMNEGSTIEIDYEKYDGEQSHRSISNIQYSDEYGDDYISAFCHLRGEDRTFKIDRILKINGVSYSNDYIDIQPQISHVIQVHKKDNFHSPTTTQKPQFTQAHSAGKSTSSNKSPTRKHKSSGCMVFLVLIICTSLSCLWIISQIMT